MIDRSFSVAINRWDWDSLRILGDHGDVVGHRVKTGSIVELQLSVGPKSIFKYWIKKSDRQQQWIIDPSYEEGLILDLGPKSNPTNRTLQPLRPHTNLAYFEGVVTRIARRDSKSERGDVFNILLDCGVPVVLEAVVARKDPSPLGADEGNEIMGFCGLMGSLSSSAALFKEPVKAKVMDIASFEDRPKIVLLTVEMARQDSVPETKIDYYALDSRSPSVAIKK